MRTFARIRMSEFVCLASIQTYFCHGHRKGGAKARSDQAAAAEANAAGQREYAVKAVADDWDSALVKHKGEDL